MQVLNNKFHENPSNGNRADTCGGTDGRTDITNLETLFATTRMSLKRATVLIFIEIRRL
jgi:hypothetical protein